ncbi:centrosomal protein of 68 kDa isoform X2 [Anabas testudineus]|uniref:centrosomal protein of 68 kDa isoform X2 n=1 Tax=Anabas testudineus TaxID=64144 RepID=UPI000E460665|nr:centrosomal protein of 68 kDa isoform X2 [Anabas testudineus]
MCGNLTESSATDLQFPQVDRNVLHFICPMEANGCSERWKTFPGLKYSRRSLSPNAKDNKTERDRGRTHKSVTLAPTSRYLTDRSYVMRKPLFSAEQQTSILKKTNPLKQTEKFSAFQDRQSDVSRRKHTDEDFQTRSREELNLESLSSPYRDITPASASIEDLDTTLGISELRSRFCHEGPVFGSPQLSLSSSIPLVQRLRPPLTSTVLYPTYIPHSGSRSGHSQLRLGRSERKGEGETKLSFFGGHSKGEPMTPYQSNYWACTIPKTSPPSPDRRSSHWNPNREYQALLDYTYPLRPGHSVSPWDSSNLHEDSVLQTDLQDSGIEMEHLCSSTSLSVLDFSVSGMGKPRERSPVGAGHRSHDLPGFTISSDDWASSTPLSLKNPVGLSLDSLDCSNDRGGLNRYDSVGHSHQQHALTSSTSTAFIRSTSVLPRSRCVGGEVDEEFWPLPEQLEELQLLSRQVREVMTHLSQPVRASWESLEPGTTSILSSITLPEKQEAESNEEEPEVEVEESKSIEENTEEGKYELDREEKSTAQTVHHRRTSGPSVEPVGEGGMTQSSLREVEALVEQLCGLTLPGNQRSRQEDQEQRDSLMRHIQVFCSHLEQLIQQLYTVSEKMELLAAPAVDIDSVKSSLAEYQSFQREVSSHRPLTSCVLQTGRLLLSCIDTTSPLLRDALLLIERQSGALQTHTELFLSSILSAMDCLTQPSQPSPVQKCGADDLHPVEIQGSTM